MAEWTKHTWETVLDLGDLGHWPVEINGRVEYSDYVEDSRIDEIIVCGDSRFDVSKLILPREQASLHGAFEEDFEDTIAGLHEAKGDEDYDQGKQSNGGDL